MSDVLSDFDIKLFKYLTAGLAASFATVIIAVFTRSMVAEHPFISIMLALASVPFAVPSYRMARPYLRDFLGKYLIAVIPAILATLAILSLTKYAVLALLLFVNAATSHFLRMFKRYHVFGFEIVMLTTVLAGAAYGPKAGAAVGAAAMLTDYVFSRRLSQFSIFTIPAYALMGLLAGNFAGASIVFVGIGLTLLYNALNCAFTPLLGFSFDKSIRFGITNVAFNIVLFSGAAPALLSFMT